MDATCAPAHIRYPQDASLLNEAREKTEELIDTLYPQSMLQSKPRTYRKQAHKEYLELARCKHPTSKKIRHAVKKKLSYLSRNTASIQTLLEHGETLTRHQKERFQTIAVLFSQQQYWKPRAKGIFPFGYPYIFDCKRVPKPSKTVWHSCCQK